MPKRNYFGVENPELLEQHNRQIIHQNMRALIGNVKPWEPLPVVNNRKRGRDQQPRFNRNLKASESLKKRFAAVEALLDQVASGLVPKPKSVTGFTDLLGFKHTWIFNYPELAQRVKDVCGIVSREEIFEANKSRATEILAAIERGELKVSGISEINRLCGMNRSWLFQIPELKAEAVRILNKQKGIKNA